MGVRVNLVQGKAGRRLAAGFWGLGFGVQG